MRACESEERHNMANCSVCLCVCVCVGSCVWASRLFCCKRGTTRRRFTSRAEFVAKANEKRKQTEADVELLVASAPYELMYIDNNG